MKSIRQSVHPSIPKLVNHILIPINNVLDNPVHNIPILLGHSLSQSVGQTLGSGQKTFQVEVDDAAEISLLEILFLLLLV